MNSKTIGSLLILGTILTMGVWMVFDLGTDSMSSAERLKVFIANNTLNFSSFPDIQESKVMLKKKNENK